MKVEKYEAVDMGEALKLVKASLGSDAVILHSRKVKKGNGAFGIFARPVVEVFATLPRSQEYAQRRPRPVVQESRSPVAHQMVAKKENLIAMEPLMDGLDDIRSSLAELSSFKENPDTTVDRISGDVRELKSMISYLLDQSDIEKVKGLPRQYLALLRILKEKGVSDEYSQGLVDLIKEKQGKGPVPDIKTMLHVALARMRDSLIFDGAIEAPVKGEKTPKVVALVGPTGVGKTTTIAKLASSLAMSGASVGLITIDTFRIAAVEQLKIYAQILRIPLEVVLAPGDLKHAINTLRNSDVVLVDTAGRSQRDFAQIGELKRFFDKTDDVDIRLVLSAASVEAQMEEAVKNFSRLDLSGLIFTKLDEAIALGPVFNLHLQTGLPVSYFTTGQNVPEDMEIASVGSFIKRLFGPDKTEPGTNLN